MYLHLGTCNIDSDCRAGEECFYNDEIYAFECKCKKGFVKTATGECRQLKSKYILLLVSEKKTLWGQLIKR